MLRLSLWFLKPYLADSSSLTAKIPVEIVAPIFPGRARSVKIGSGQFGDRDQGRHKHKGHEVSQRAIFNRFSFVPLRLLCGVKGIPAKRHQHRKTAHLDIRYVYSI